MGFLRRQPVAVLALVIALVGTSAAAKPLLTGADIKDRTLRTQDVRVHSLGRVDLSPNAPRGARGPRGPRGPVGPLGPSQPPAAPSPDLPIASATIAADGTVTRGAATVIHPGTGTYCVAVPGARWVQVSMVTAGRVAAAVVIPDGQAPCTAGATVRVALVDGSGQPADGAFHLLARNG